MIVEVRKTYKYRLYKSKRDHHLHNQIDIAGLIWNHCVALQRRYYRLFGTYIGKPRLQKHLAHLRMKTNKYAHWKKLGSQVVQQVTDRLHASYQRFFSGEAGRPSFKKVKKYRSFTLKQAGWDLLGGNKVRIGKHHYKFVKHREMGGDIKTVTIKRDACRRLWICFSVKEKIKIPEASSGEIGGFDFGLKSFLTDHTGKRYDAPLYFQQQLDRVRKLSRAVSRKVKGSRNQKKARWLLHRTLIRVADKRQDFHYQLAYELCNTFEVLVFEDLNLAGMKRLWGRKVSDLGFAKFIKIVEQVAFKRGKTVIFINRFEPTSQICSNCGKRQKLKLSDRIYQCECGLCLDRDHNAAINIQRAGASAHTARE